VGAGGPPHYFLEQIRELYPISLHGVGLSIGSDGALDLAHLQRLKTLNERYKPGLFSEHLAWSTHEGVYFNDLLPLPYTKDSVQRVAGHISQVQDALGRQMLLENPSTYVTFEDSTMSEIAFLSAVVEQSGCALLLDVNNVFVSSVNHGVSSKQYIDDFPLDLVGEIHLGGHAEDEDDQGQRLLIDAHDREIVDPVWSLYDHVTSLAGKLPTLVEWDNDVPRWDTLFAEAKRAETILKRRKIASGADAVAV